MNVLGINKDKKKDKRRKIKQPLCTKGERKYTKAKCMTKNLPLTKVSWYIFFVNRCIDNKASNTYYV